MDLQCDALKEELLKLSPKEIVSFDTHFTQAMDEAFHWDLWGAAYLMGDGCSDDWFDYFCRWLISLGRPAFDAALKDPDSLADVARAPGVEDVFFEQFGWSSFEFKGGELYHNAWIAGLFIAIGLTGFAVLLATLFNLITDLVGGVRVSVLEEEVVARTSTSKVSSRLARLSELDEAG